MTGFDFAIETFDGSTPPEDDKPPFDMKAGVGPVDPNSAEHMTVMQMASHVTPALRVLEEARTVIESSTDRYGKLRTLVQNDSDVFGHTNTLATMVQRCYQGLDTSAFGDTLDEDEKDCMEAFEEILDEIDIVGMLYNITFNKFPFGDDVWYCTNMDSTQTEFPDLRPLAIEYLTAVDKEDDVGVGGTISENITDEIIVENANFYVVNEDRIVERRKDYVGPDKDKYRPHSGDRVYPKEKILHFSWTKRGQMIVDNVGRTTFGVWSASPVESIYAVLLWKHSTIVADIMWRAINVPRLQVQTDISFIRYDQIRTENNTQEEKIAAYQSMINTHLAFTRGLLTQTEVDQGVVVPDDVTQKRPLTTISYTEPRTQNYASPNELLYQIAAAMASVSGVPQTALSYVKGGGGSFASELITANYAAMRAESLATADCRIIFRFVKEWMAKKYNGKYEKILPKIKPRIKMVLEKDFAEMARTAALLYETGKFPSSEIRSMVGLPPLTKEQEASLKKDIEMRAEAKQSVSDISGDKARTQTPKDAAGSTKTRTGARVSPRTQESNRSST